MSEPIYSILTSKGCVGDCQCTWYWYDYNLGDTTQYGMPGMYGWYGSNTCGSCFVPGTPENDYSDQIGCSQCDWPSFDGTTQEQMAQTPCYRS